MEHFLIRRASIHKVQWEQSNSKPTMWNIFFVFLLCLPASVPVRRDRSIDSWFRGLKRNMKKRSLNLPDVPAIVMNRLPSKRESFDSMVDGVMSDSIPLRAMPIRPVTRKEYRCLKHDERSKLHEALQKTKQTMEGPLSQYDYFVSQHEDSRAPGAHFGPAFGPWHRHYLYQWVFCYSVVFVVFKGAVFVRLNVYAFLVFEIVSVMFKETVAELFC